MPWTTANEISINYQLAGTSGPLVVLMHELGGTLDSWEAVVPGAYQNPEFMQKIEDRGFAVSIGAGTRATATLTVIRQ